MLTYHKYLIEIFHIMLLKALLRTNALLIAYIDTIFLQQVQSSVSRDIEFPLWLVKISWIFNSLMQNMTSITPSSMIKVLFRIQGRHGWQGPQGLGLA